MGPTVFVVRDAAGWSILGRSTSSHRLRIRLALILLMSGSRICLSGDLLPSGSLPQFGHRSTQ